MPDDHAKKPDHDPSARQSPETEEAAPIDPNDLDARLDAVLTRIEKNEPKLYERALETPVNDGMNTPAARENVKADTTEETVSDDVAGPSEEVVVVADDTPAEEIAATPTGSAEEEVPPPAAVASASESADDPTEQQIAAGASVTFQSGESLVEQDLANLEKAVEEVAASAEQAGDAVVDLDSAIGAQLDALINQQISSNEPPGQNLDIAARFAAKAAESQARIAAEQNTTEDITTAALGESPASAESSAEETPAEGATQTNEDEPAESDEAPTLDRGAQRDPLHGSATRSGAANTEPAQAVEAAESVESVQTAPAAAEVGPSAEELADQILAGKQEVRNDGLDEADFEQQLASLLNQAAPQEPPAVPAMDVPPAEPVGQVPAITEETAEEQSQEIDPTAALDAALDEMLSTQPSTEEAESSQAVSEEDDMVEESSGQAEEPAEDLAQLDAMLAGEAVKEIEQELTPADAVEANHRADLLQGKEVPAAVHEVAEDVDESTDTEQGQSQQRERKPVTAKADTGSELDAALDEAGSDADESTRNNDIAAESEEDDESSYDDADAMDEEPILAGSMKERLIRMAKDLPRQMLTVQTARRVCTVLNAPALGMKRETRNMIGYIGLVTLFNATALLLYNLFH